MLVVMLESAEVGPSFAEVPGFFLCVFFFNAENEKCFPSNFFSTQAAFSPLPFIARFLR